MPRPITLLRHRMATLGFASLLFTGGCIPLPRYEPIAKTPTQYPVERLAQELDPWLLADGLADRLIVEIDWVAGCEPGPRTLRGFERMLSRYVPEDRVVEVRLDDEIPASAWHDSDDQASPVPRLVERFAGTVARPEPGAEKRYVMFVPESEGSFGLSTSWQIERGGRPVTVRGVIVARGAHERAARLWLSRDRFERGTLIHEFGHQFGLVTNDRHERVATSHTNHCTGLSCLMAHPTPKVLVHNAPRALFNVLPRDYCKRCRGDIRQAQAYWRETMAADPEYATSLERRRDLLEEQAVLVQLLRDRKHEELLKRIELLRESATGETFLGRLAAHALVASGRETEAVERLLAVLPDDPADRWYWKLRQQTGRLLVGLGRHVEAIALFDRSLLASAGAYDFEQSAFVLLTALSGAGRFAEGAVLIAELLARGDAISFRREGMLHRRASLLRRAGTLDQADELVSAGLGRKRERGSWLGEAYRLRAAQGRLDESAALFVELLDDVEHRYGKATEPRERWILGWQSVALLAKSGDVARAGKRAEQLEAAGNPEGIHFLSEIRLKIPAWIALDEFELAAGLVFRLSVHQRGTTDPCGMEALEPLRAAGDHAELFADCPPGRRVHREPFE